MRLVWSHEAIECLVEIRAWIEQENPRAAQQVADAIYSAAESLRRFPRMGRHGRRSGTRERVVPGTPYVMPYRVRKGIVEIVAVIHGARGWPPET
jgi:toxin ParE1/3/4